MQNTVFCTFLVVDNELHRRACSIWPVSGRWVLAISAQVSWILGHCSLSSDRYHWAIISRSSSVIEVKFPIGITRVTTACR